ncbi:hypothetical protein ACFOSV_01640 [Algoriphagus namhaensis]|uniref:Uncharacterized protein n=1 Tax=Algoriphagus namhaensis TaxID=915353 RepID=A0ABV8AMA2_9BACT
MKLSSFQITQLKKLISYKGYPEIDVQYEILDHVACKVEKLLEQNPSLALDDAFRKVHSEFGIFGFSDLADSYRKSIEKRFWKNYLLEIRNLFLSYRIILPLLLSALIYQASNLIDDPKSWILFLAGFCLLGSLFLIVKYWRKHSEYKNYAAYLSSNHIFQLLNIGLLCSLYSYQHVYSASFENDPLFVIVLAGIIGFILVWFALSLFTLPRLLDKTMLEIEELKKIYGS